MRTVFMAAVAIVAWLAASTVAAHYWVTTPGFPPSLPAPLADWLISRYKPVGGEEIRDLEFMIGFGIYALFFGLILVLGALIIRRRRTAQLPARKA